jgi:hypothetical protein
MIRPAHRHLTKLSAAASVLGIVLVSTACGVDHSDGEVSSAAQALSPISAESPVDELDGDFNACKNHWDLAQVSYTTRMAICLDTLERELGRYCDPYNTQFPPRRRQSADPRYREEKAEDGGLTEASSFCLHLERTGTPVRCIAACNGFDACESAATAWKAARYSEFRQCQASACARCAARTGYSCCGS